MFVDCILSRGSLYEKGFGIRSVSKLTLGFQTLFQFASQTRTALPSGLPLWGLWRCFRRFAVAKRAGALQRSAERVILVPIPRRSANPARFFRRKNGAPPRAVSHNRICHLFSLSLPKQANQRLVFGWVLGRSFCLKSCLPNILFLHKKPLPCGRGRVCLR